MFAGMTLYEQGLGRRPVWIRDNAHWLLLAMTGAGKFTNAQALQAILHPGSAVFISPKAEMADFALGRRVDPRLFAYADRSRAKQALGVDPRGKSRVKFHIPNSRSFVLDPSGQSVYPSCRYNPLDDVDLSKPNARSLLMALATASFPDKKKGNSDPWFTHTPRALLGAGCAHKLTADPNPANHTLPAVIDMLMGVDPRTGTASPAYFESVLKSMMGNNSLGGFIQSAASNVYQLGDKSFGSIYSEFENNCRWATDGWMRECLSGPSGFSFFWLGDDQNPVTIFIVALRGARSFQASIPWLRTISELSLEIFATRTTVGKVPVLWCGDEYRSWGGDIESVQRGFGLLRDRGVKLSLCAQSWDQLVDMFGQHGAAELESCSTMQYFGVNDLSTADRISRRLGKHVVRQSRGFFKRHTSYVDADLITPAEVMQELRSSSNLQYVFPSSTLPMRLERVAYKPMRTKDGGKFAGLPLAGHYDEGLTR